MKKIYVNCDCTWCGQNWSWTNFLKPTVLLEFSKQKDWVDRNPKAGSLNIRQKSKFWRFALDQFPFLFRQFCLWLHGVTFSGN